MAENEQISVFDQQSYADQAMDYNELIKESVFKGEVPLQVIIEGITEQFEDYINIEDKTNYVDVFFNQYHDSVNAILTEDNDDHPEERKEILDDILNNFISTIGDLFKVRLSITIIPIDEESFNIDEVESILRALYEFFILKARDNFITVLSGDINLRLQRNITDNRQFIAEVKTLLESYTPIITTITVNDFLKIRGEETIIEMNDNNQWTGNFLMKYSPKLYQNETLAADIITQTAIIYDIKEELSNG